MEQSALMPIPFIPIQEQNVIQQEIERRFSIADETEKDVKQNLRQSEFLRQTVLKNAFEGKIIPQDPADEPAGKLLERIKAERITNKSKNNQLELPQYVK
jgi:type I restriction enzyme S subunit